MTIQSCYGLRVTKQENLTWGARHGNKC